MMNRRSHNAIRVLSAIRWFIDFVSREGGKVVTLAMVSLICIDVIMRASIGRSTLIAGEVSGYMLVALVMLSLAHAERMQRHVDIDLLTRRFPQRFREWLKLVMLVGSIAYLLWFISATVSPVIHNYVQGVRSVTGLATPMWIPYLFVPLGAGMLLVELVAETVSQVRRCISPAIPYEAGTSSDASNEGGARLFFGE